MQPEARPSAMQIGVKGVEAAMNIVCWRDQAAVQSCARWRCVGDEQVDGGHLPQEFGDLPFCIMIRGILLVAWSATAAAQSQTTKCNGARVQTFEGDSYLRIVVSEHAQQRNPMRHKGNIVERAFIDIAERNDKIVRLRRQLRHAKTIRRMNVSYRVNAKLLRFHSVTEHPSIRKQMPEISEFDLVAGLKGKGLEFPVAGGPALFYPPDIGIRAASGGFTGESGLSSPIRAPGVEPLPCTRGTRRCGCLARMNRV